MAKRLPHELTKREAETAAHILFGSSNKEIADAFSIADKSPKFHVTKLYQKMGYGPEYGKSARHKFMADYFLGRLDEEKIWLVSRYLATMIMKPKKEQEPKPTELPRQNEGLPRGI